MLDYKINFNLIQYAGHGRYNLGLKIVNFGVLQ